MRRLGCIEDVTRLSRLAEELRAASRYLWYEADRIKPDNRKAWELGMRTVSADMRTIEERLFKAHPTLRRFLNGSLWPI